MKDQRKKGRTQTLKTINEINSGIFISNIKLY